MKIITFILGGIVVMSLAGIFLLFYYLAPDCGNEIYQSIPSPDRSHKVVLYSRDCGATTGFSTHISILQNDETIEGGGNTFVADSDHGEASSHPKYVSLIDVQIQWVDNSTVKIRYDKNARIFTQDHRSSGVDIIYSK